MAANNKTLDSDIEIIRRENTKPMFTPVKAQWQRQQCQIFNINSQITFDSNEIIKRIGKTANVKNIRGDGNCFLEALTMLKQD